MLKIEVFFPTAYILNETHFQNECSEINISRHDTGICNVINLFHENENVPHDYRECSGGSVYVFKFVSNISHILYIHYIAANKYL